MKIKVTLGVVMLVWFLSPTIAQPFSAKKPYTRADTLRGTIGKERVWWDVLKYDLHVAFNEQTKTISGYNTIYYKVLSEYGVMQIDLNNSLSIDSCFALLETPNKGKIGITINEQNVRKEGNAYFFSLPKSLPGLINQLTIYYHGQPKVAILPPWDGGIVWTKDKNNNPWISIACQGLGASSWFPCKDQQDDEPDSVDVYFTCSKPLVCISNGNLKEKKENTNNTITYHWSVKSPINNYCVIPYIGKYVNFSETYKGEKGNLLLDYWVLEENLEKAKKHFKEAPKTLKAFEYWFGPYPFYEDGYKLVDAPYLGMEHQSAIAYGNGYENGYAGEDLSKTDWGKKWDFIIVHETGHEWFGNNITTKDIADMWVHEGFTDYSETLFTEYYYGKEAANAYCIGKRKRILNDRPIIGSYGVNKEGSTDMYYKAGNMIHTIRQIINDDVLFRKLLRGLNELFYHKTVTTQEIENYINKQSKINFSTVFDQYLRTTQIPVLNYKIENGILTYYWTNCIKGFNMPVKISLIKGKYTFIYPTELEQTLQTKLKNTNQLIVNPNFYINIQKL